MDKLKSLIEQIDSLKKELDKLQPLKKEDEERLWEKFRLEWNYNSNHIEGNTLSYGETYLLLIKGDVIGDHKAQEIDEMRAHDLVVFKVKEYAEDKARELTEADIREWNKIILVRPYWKEAQTLDGQSTRKLIEPGNYKKTPNSVLLANGEVFPYASPEETPILMKELIEWYRNESKKKELHPIQLGALLHYKLVRIHPFDDSNGRTSRLLMNYELLKNGFPPVIIKSEDKKNYLFALSKADSGDLDAFVEYIAKQIEWSFGKSIDAALGKNIEDEEDLEKDISLWKRLLNAKAKDKPEKSIEVVIDVYGNSLVNLFETFIKKHEQFNEAFVQNKVSAYAEGTGQQLKDVFLDLGKYFEQVIKDYQNKSKSFSTLYKNEWSILYTHEVLRSSEPNNFYVNSDLKVVFHPLHYEIFITKNSYTNKFYSEKLSNAEIASIVKIAISEVFEVVKKMK